MAGRYALIVANDVYEDPKLKQLRGPAKDADALARVLGDPAVGDFEVDLVVNQPQHLLRRKVNRFFENRRHDDTLLLHFSCHGLKDDSGELFFATSDTEVDHLEDSALESAWVRRRLDASLSKRIIVLLDCCYSGAFTAGMRSRAGDAVHAVEHLEGTGRVVLTSSSALEYAWEGDTLRGEAKPSVFTSALLAGIETGEADRDGDSWVSVGELYDYVFQWIMDSGARQTPGRSGEVRGDLRVARSRREPPGLPPDVDALFEVPIVSSRLGLVEHLGALADAGSGPVVAAWRGLERLRDSDDSLRVREAAATALAERPQPARPDRDQTPTEDAPALVRLEHDDAVMTVAFGPDGRLLASGCRDQTARLWGIAAGAEQRRFEHDDWVIAADVSPDGRLLATGCRDHTARIWDLETGTERARLRHDGVVWAVAFSPDGRLLATGGADATARLLDVDEGREQRVVAHEASVVAVRFDPDGRRLATADERRTARVHDLTDGREAARLTASGAILTVGFDAEGRALAVCAAPDAVCVLDIHDGRELARVAHAGVRAVALGPERRRLATAGDDGTTRVWELGEGRELDRLEDVGRVRALAFAADARRLAVAGGDGAVRIWAPRR
jgi:hypothetical protein